MTSKTALGPHVVDNMYADGADHRHFVKGLVRDLNSAWVNVLRASQADEALQTALEIRRDVPETQVMVRHRFGHLATGDENVMQVFPNPSDYYREVCAQYIGLGVTLVAGNEIATDWNRYVDYFEVVGELAAADALSLGMGRSSSWHPYREHFGKFDRLGNLLAKYPLHKLTPNVYYVARPEPNYDAIYKNIEFWEWLGKPEMVIGEFARIWDFDPHKGYRWEGMSEEAAAHEMVDLVKAHYSPRGIAVLWYCLGLWPLRASTFHTGAAFHRVLNERQGEIRLSPPPTPPQDGEGSFVVEVTAVPGLRLRSVPVDGVVRAILPTGARLGVLEAESAKEKIGRADAWLRVRWLGDGAEGYVSGLYVRPLPPALPGEGEFIPLAEHERIVGDYEAKLDAIREIVG